MISKFKLFESKSDIDAICKKYKIKNYTINDDLSISVDGDVDLYDMGLRKIPLKFKEVSGHFHCGNNRLESLEGCPEIVGGNFYCYGNNIRQSNRDWRRGLDRFRNGLESLQGCPVKVGGNFGCYNNELKSLEFCPREVGGDFNCHCNNIINFDGLPELFESYIDISENPVYEIYRLFNNDPKCIYWIKEFDAIQGDEIIRDRLEEVYVHMGLETPLDFKFKYYTLI